MRPGFLKSGFSQRYLLGWQSVQPVAAYSCFRALAPRKISSLPLIRVRESSGNVEKDIYARGRWLDVATLLAHCAGASGYVTKIWDQSGAGRTLSQLTTSKQPRIVNAGVLDTQGTNKPAPLWDGTDDDVGRTADAFGLSGSPALTVGFAGTCTSGGSTIAYQFGTNLSGGGGGNDKWFGWTPTDASESPDGSGTTQGANSYKEFTGYGAPGTTHYHVAGKAANVTASAHTLSMDGVALSQKVLGSTASSNAMSMTNTCAHLGSAKDLGNYCNMKCNIWVVYNAVLAGDDLTYLNAELAEHCS